MTSAPIGRFTDYDSLIELLRQRKAELGLSDLVLGELAGFADGHAGKVLGRSRVKGVGRLTLGPLLDALGLSGTLYADPKKTAYLRAGRRKESSITDNGRVSRAALAKIRPLAMIEAARKAARTRWARATPGDRAAAVARMNAARLAKRGRTQPQGTAHVGRDLNDSNENVSTRNRGTDQTACG